MSFSNPDIGAVHLFDACVMWVVEARYSRVFFCFDFCDSVNFNGFKSKLKF